MVQGYTLKKIGRLRVGACLGLKYISMERRGCGTATPLLFFYGGLVGGRSEALHTKLQSAQLN